MQLLKKHNKVTEGNKLIKGYSRKSYLISVTVLVILFFTPLIDISAQSTGNTAASTEENWQRGENLFVGKIRFTNGGPACNSCHNVSINGFVSGGALAKDLTQSVSRLTPDGAKAFFGGPIMPMPQMQQSYSGRPLTSNEVDDILSFLVYSDNMAKKTQASSPVASRMLTGGIVGVIGLLILFSIFWIKRKQRPVNFRVFERQIKSS